jgi:hypothetical protein
MLPGLAASVPDQSAAAATSLTFIGSLTFSGATITIPNDGSVLKDDLAVVFTGAFATGSTAPTTVLFPGFTNLSDVGVPIGPPTPRVRLDAKVIDAADLGATLTGVDGSSIDDKVLAWFRPNGALGAITVEDAAIGANAGDPAQIQVSLSGARLRLVVGHAWANNTGVTATGTLPTNGVSLAGVSTRHRSYYEIMTGSPPATRTIDMGDNGVNAMQIASIVFAPT